MTGVMKFLRCLLTGLPWRSEWKERHAAVVAELKKRESETKAAAVHHAHSEGWRAAKPPAADLNQPTFKAKMTPADVNKQWARAVAKKALPLTFVDDPEVRLAIYKNGRVRPSLSRPEGASRPRRPRRYAPAEEERIPVGACDCG